MDLRDLRGMGLSYLGLAALLADVFDNPHLLLDALTFVSTGRDKIDADWARSACRLIAENQESIIFVNSSVRADFVTWTRELEPRDIDRLRAARAAQVKLPGPARGFPDRAFFDRLRRELAARDLRARGQALQRAPRNADYARYQASLAEFNAACAHMLAIAHLMTTSDDTGTTKKTKHNCWTRIQSLHGELIGQRQVTDTTSVSLNAFHPAGDPVLQNNTYETVVFSLPGVADAVIPQGALLVFFPPRVAIYGHFAIYVGNGNCVSYNNPTGVGVRTEAVGSLRHQYPSVGVVIPIALIPPAPAVAVAAPAAVVGGP